jgi:hypothetical protein
MNRNWVSDYCCSYEAAGLWKTGSDDRLTSVELQVVLKAIKPSKRVKKSPTVVVSDKQKNVSPSA